MSLKCAMKVVITGTSPQLCVRINHSDILLGASGVLGTAVFQAFKNAGIDVVGLANSRAGTQYSKLDLTDKGEVREFLSKIKPNCGFIPKVVSREGWEAYQSSFFPCAGVIHCAAERRPDVAEKVCKLHCEL